MGSRESAAFAAMRIAYRQGRYAAIPPERLRRELEAASVRVRSTDPRIVFFGWLFDARAVVPTAGGEQTEWVL